MCGEYTFFEVAAFGGALVLAPSLFAFVYMTWPVLLRGLPHGDDHGE